MPGTNQENFMYDPKDPNEVNALVITTVQLAMDVISGEISHIKDPATRFLISNRIAAFIFQANFKIHMNFAENQMIDLKERIELKSLQVK